MSWSYTTQVPSVTVHPFDTDEPIQAEDLPADLFEGCNPEPEPVTDRDGSVWVAHGADGLTKKSPAGTLHLSSENTPLAGREARHVTLDPAGMLWIATDRGVCIHDGHEGWIRLGGSAGMPAIDVRRVLLCPGGERWFATSGGVVRLADGAWSLFSGRRWLPTDDVIDLAIVDSSTIAVQCADGEIRGIRTAPTTLEGKTDTIEAAIDARHRRRGYVSDCQLDVPGCTDDTTYVASDNDGLWTAMYLASECFRHAVTGDDAAKIRARESMDALLRLEQVTGISGFPARAVVGVDEPEVIRSDGEWHASPCGQWVWKGDTSSDELNGHFFALPLYYELIADSSERLAIQGMVGRVVDHLLEYDFRLIDVDGERTRWGVFSPMMLNGTSEWAIERGLNSLSMLSFLKVAHAICGTARYEVAYKFLCKRHHYALNTIDQKIRMPGEVNHSDDELTFLAYYSLFMYERDPDLLALYRLSIQRTMADEQPEQNPLWNLIASNALGRDMGISDAVRSLQEMPTDRINWGRDHTRRADVAVRLEPDRHGSVEGDPVLPYSENGMLKWNGNPYQLRRPGAGRTEDDGAAFLLPYWLGRYHGLIHEA